MNHSRVNKHDCVKRTAFVTDKLQRLTKWNHHGQIVTIILDGN